MSNCHACEARLWHDQPIVSERDVVEVCVYQQEWLDALSRGHATIGGGQTLYSHLFFAGLRILFQNIAAGSAGRKLRSVTCDGTFDPAWQDDMHAIERLEVSDRFVVALIAGRLLSDWPRNYIQACRSAGVTSSHLIGALKSVPYWYYRVVDENFSYGSYSPTLPEISNAIQYLKRHGRPVSKGNLSRLLGVSDVVRKRRLDLRLF
jgi:hypothetical protein